MRNDPRIVIVGAGGRLGSALLRASSHDYEVSGFNHQQLDLADAEQLRAKLRPLDFGVLINTAAQTNVDRCEAEAAEAFRLNAEAPRVLAEICAEKKARLIHISTDYVFDGEKTEPYTEEDEPRPINVYGSSKLEGERAVLAIDENHLVVRVSWLFGPDRPSFVDWIVQQACEHDQVKAVADKFSTPTYALDLAEMLRPLLWSRRAPAPEGGGEDQSAATGPRAGRLQGEPAGGIIHLTNRGVCSWREYGQWALDCCAVEGVPLRARKVRAISLSEMKNFVARRPIQTALSTAKYERLTGTAPRDWREAVAEYVREHLSSGGGR